MNSITKKILKVSGITLATIGGLLLLLVTIALYAVVTPEKLTPIARAYAHKYLDADVKIGSVEATFFSSFPRFGIKVDSVEIVSHALHTNPTDTIFSRRDTVLVLSELTAGLDLIHTLRTNEIVIGRTNLTNAQLRLYTDSIGRHNWDIIKPDTLETEDDTTSFDYILSFKHIELDNVKLRYSDKISQTHVSLDSVYMRTEGDINLDSLNVDIEFKDKSSSLKIDGTRYIRRLPIGFNGHIFYDYNDERYKFDETCVNLDSHDIDIDGWFKTDSTGVDMDFKYELESPSIEKLFAIIPKDIVGQDIMVENGSISASGTLKGRLDDTNSPVIECAVSLNDIKGHYEGMKKGIEDVTAQFNTLIDAQRPDSSFMNLEIFHFKGGNSEVTSTVKATELLDDPYIDAKINAHIDLASILDVFPMANTRMKGLVNADIATQFRYSDIKKYDFGRIKARGKLDVDSISIVDDSLKFSMHSDAHIKFEGRDTLKAGVKLSKFELDHPHAKIVLRDFVGGVKTVFNRDTTRHVPLKAAFSANRLGLQSDSVVLYFKNIKASGSTRPMAWNKKKLHLEAKLKSDTIFSNFWSIRGFTKNLDAYSMLEQTGDSTWNSDMYTQFAQVKVYMPHYKIPIISTNTRITQGDRTINIERSHIKIGKSEMDVKATIHNLFYSLYSKQPFNASLTLNADTINCNELLNAYIDNEDEFLETSSVISDTTIVNSHSDDLQQETPAKAPSAIVTIPKRIHMNINTNIASFKYDSLNVRDIKGTVVINNRCLHATNIRFKHGNSNAISILAYKGHRRKQYADLDAFIRWERADIAEIVEDLHLDTIMPMLGSMKGQVDCYMTIKTKLDSLMNPDLNTASASIHFGGKSMTLLDGETFQRISKLLMFKNKKKNIIDTLAMNVLVDSGKIEILPFAMTIDRYTAAVGGSQDFDMNLNYHISLLKSPLPFKAGVTIKGNINNLNWDSFDLTKAKLKRQVSAKDMMRNDSISLSRRIAVIRETFKMSGLPIPEQLQTDEEKQKAQMKKMMKEAEEADIKEQEEQRRLEVQDSIKALSDSTIITTPQ
ncbi:MAG: AsmA family protein [Bacteroidales bacterium]|nr:AsmA family protein [Bacteroidales bacterium]